MQLLQLVEGADYILLVGQLFSSLAKSGLQLQVLLKVVLACFAVQAQHIVELLYVQLIVAPQFVGFISWHILNFAPLLLQALELLVVLVSLVGGGYHSLDTVDDSQFLGQVLLLFSLLLLENLGALFFDDAHLSLESLFLLVGRVLVLLRIAACIEISFELSLALSYVQFVERRLQILYFVLLWYFLAMCNVLQTVQYIGFGLINHTSLLLGLLSCWLRVFSCFYLRGNLFVNYFFVFTQFEGILLRVHHLTIKLLLNDA